MELSILSSEGGYYFLRWLHYFFGVTWVGILYYFNFVQGEWFKEIDATAKNGAITKLVPRALKWFRHAAMVTWISGILMLGHKGGSAGWEIYSTSWGLLILIGALLGTIMFLNVWLVIWPNQKIVIANAEQVMKGGAANPDAAGAGARALLASRTNTMFSIPMLFFMGAASHLPLNLDVGTSLAPLWAVMFLIIGALELNALKGKLGPLTTVRGVVHCGVGLTVVLYAMTEILS